VDFTETLSDKHVEKNVLSFNRAQREKGILMGLLDWCTMMSEALSPLWNQANP